MTNSKEEKGIDWTKDNIYDGIGRPDLKPPIVCTCTFPLGDKCENCKRIAPAPRTGDWEKEFDELFSEILSVRDPIYGAENRTWRGKMKSLLASSTTEAERRERELAKNEISKAYEEGLICAGLEERERLSRAIEAEGINLPTGKMDSAAIEAVSFFIRKGKQRFNVPDEGKKA